MLAQVSNHYSENLTQSQVLPKMVLSPKLSGVDRGGSEGGEKNPCKAELLFFPKTSDLVGIMTWLPIFYLSIAFCDLLMILR